MSMTDIVEEGLKNGWDVVDASRLDNDQTMEADVVIIGTGAGGGTTAEILAESGLKVIMIEEGRLHRQKDFRMQESEAYPKLYQEGMSRVTADGSISIMQGRTVGGSTTVNWTSSFRTPKETLDHWTSEYGLKGFSEQEMQPWFENREKRLGIEPWGADPNPNNTVLKRGCESLGWSWQVIPRNVRGCWNLGYCGMGCPTNAKQSMLITTVPGALNAGARLVFSAKAQRLIHQGDQISELVCHALDQDALDETGKRITIKARHFVVSASALGSPALLLRSDIPDPYDRIGKRTFLHPVNVTVAEMPESIDPWHGAPQSIYSDQFNWSGGAGGPAGFKMEVPPLHPGLASAVLGTHGDSLTEIMDKLPSINSMLSLMRDGFHEESQGGTVTLRSNGNPVLDYPVSDYLWTGLREAFLRMTELQFAAGAKWSRPLHLDGKNYSSWREAEQGIKELPMAPHRVRLFTAHQMGGCAMGEDPTRSVVNSDGKHHHMANLHVIDGSTFPTSIGANPQLSIYGMAARQATLLAKQLNS